MLGSQLDNGTKVCTSFSIYLTRSKKVELEVKASKEGVNQPSPRKWSKVVVGNRDVSRGAKLFVIAVGRQIATDVMMNWHETK
ncbi:hypothetical protein Ancab_016255, partial [Ancistrocladus abbreviatus]